MTKPFPSLQRPEVSSKFAPFMLSAAQRAPVQLSILAHKFVGLVQAYKVHEIPEQRCTLLVIRFELTASQQVAEDFISDATERAGQVIEMHCYAPHNQSLVVMGVDEFEYAENTKIPVEVQLVAEWV
ncbi:MAG: hypothetical protein WC052_06135 [Patescibacteria group bacterium]